MLGGRGVRWGIEGSPSPISVIPGARSATRDLGTSRATLYYPLGPGARLRRDRDDASGDGVWLDHLQKEIAPLWVRGFDEFKLPLAKPALDLFFALDGFEHEVMLFVPDEQFAAVFLCEAFDLAFSVQLDAREEIAGDAGVERAVALRRENVDGDEIVARHGAYARILPP